MYPGFGSALWNGGVSRRIRRCSRSISQLLHRRHRLARAFRIAKTRDDRPALRDGIDAALGVLRRPEWRAVIEVRPAVPFAVPCSFERVFQLSRRAPDRSPACWLSPRDSASAANGPSSDAKKPAEPHAFAPALCADFVHAVVPIAGADERQPMHARLHRPRDRARAVFVDRQLLVHDAQAFRTRCAHLRSVRAATMSGASASKMSQSPVTRAYSSAAYTSQRRSSWMRVRTPSPPGSCHQCCTSPSGNCRPAARTM